MFDEQSGIARTGCGKIATDVRSVGYQTKTSKEAEKIRRFPPKPLDGQPQQHGNCRSDDGTSTVNKQWIFNIAGVRPRNRQQNDLQDRCSADPRGENVSKFVNRLHAEPACSQEQQNECPASETIINEKHPQILSI